MYFASAIYLHRPIPSGPVSVEAARYIGVTCKTPQERLADHLVAAKYAKTRNHRVNWYRSLKEPPHVEVLEYVFPWNREAREKYWIALFRDYGHALVNISEGGNGFAPGHRHPEEVKQKISKVMTGHARSETRLLADAEHRTKMIGRKNPKASSHFWGVSLIKSTGKWRASVSIPGRRTLNLGHFDIEEEAAQAVDAYVILNSLSRPLNFT